jgi:lysophospholipase L1-like esterase
MENRRILCFGDSNTWGNDPSTGERYPRSVRWTGVLAEELGASFEVVEEGQNGRTTVWDDPIEGEKNGLRYLTPCLESHAPLDLVILMLGTNDLKARFSLTASDIARGVERLILLILSSGCGPVNRPPAVLLMAPPPVDPRDDLDEMFLGARQKSLHFASRYAALAQLYGCIYFDVSQVIAVDPIDGIHYSALAHVALGKAVAKIVHSHFQEQ